MENEKDVWADVVDMLEFIRKRKNKKWVQSCQPIGETTTGIFFKAAIAEAKGGR